MMTTFKSALTHRGALCVLAIYGVVAGLIYLIGVLCGGDGPTGAWLVIFYSAWPISQLFVIGVSSVEGYISDGFFKFLYSASPILAGLLWSYLIARCLFALRAKLKRS